MAITGPPIGYDDVEPHHAGNNFTLVSASTAKGVNVAAWNASNDRIKAISWRVLDSRFGLGATLAQGNAAVSSNFNRLNFYNVFVTDSTFEYRFRQWLRQLADLLSGVPCCLWHGAARSAGRGGSARRLTRRVRRLARAH